MAVKEYKLIIMGASGAGKTVFLGSYFYATILQGMNKNHDISPQKDAINAIQKLTSQLFKGALGGTDKRVNLSFNVDDTMAVHLSDLPGGYTTDVEQWLAQGVEDDLKSADGVIFFISADDLLHNYARCTADIYPFQRAISQHVRINEEKYHLDEDRADVPIFFLFTKGDLIRDDRDEKGRPYTAETLMDKFPGLDKATKHGAENKFFIKKGKRDRPYLTCAMGDWLDANTPPSENDYKPVNLVEPMEDLFDAMQEARAENESLLRKPLRWALDSWASIGKVKSKLFG